MTQSITVLCLEWPSPTHHVGGVGRYSYRLTRWLAQHVSIDVVTGPDPEPLDDVSIHPVDASYFKDRFHRFYVAPIAAARLVRGLDSEVVHSHGDDVPLAWGAHPPIVRTYYGRAAAEASSSRWLRRLNHTVLSGFEHIVRPRLATAVGIGPDSVSAFRAQDLIPPVLPDDLPSTVAEQRSNSPTVVFVGGFHGRKRGAVALTAATETRRRVRDLRFVVFGPPADRPSYPGWVDFRAGATDEEVRATLAEAWALLAPSTYEGFGIPAWEAMASGAAVIGTPNAGLRFLAGDNGAALMLDDAAISSALLRLLVNDEERARVTSAGRVRAEEVAAMADPNRYLRLFEHAASH